MLVRPEVVLLDADGVLQLSPGRLGGLFDLAPNGSDPAAFVAALFAARGLGRSAQTCMPSRRAERAR